jgi:hypothetical protein
MSGAGKLTRCSDVAPLLVFYVCDEVDAQERAQIEAHLASCPTCAAQLNEEDSLRSALAESLRPADQLDPSGILLAQCRSELSETLDDLVAPPVQEHWRPFGWMHQWMALRPALSGAFLLLFGLALGTQVPQWLATNNLSNLSDKAMNVRPSPRLTEDQLSKMAVAGINFSPSSDSTPGTLQVQLNAEQPLTLSGSVDDPEMVRVLTLTLVNGDRSDAGVKLDCLEALKARVQDLQVRQALLTAARRDQNPAVRIKAIESLRDSAADESVRETLLDALEHDTNPGVRVEAVNLLVRSLEKMAPGSSAASPESDTASLPADASFERVVHALEGMQHRDPNHYVRLRSAAALRQIGPHELQ